MTFFAIAAPSGMEQKRLNLFKYIRAKIGGMKLPEDILNTANSERPEAMMEFIMQFLKEDADLYAMAVKDTGVSIVPGKYSSKGRRTGPRALSRR